MMKRIGQVVLAVAIAVSFASLCASCATDHARRTQVLTFNFDPNAARELSAVGQRQLSFDSNGCVRAGEEVIVAPEGSRVNDDKAGVHLQGIGDFKMGATLPVLSGVNIDRADAQSKAWVEMCPSDRYMKVYPDL